MGTIQWEIRSRSLRLVPNTCAIPHMVYDREAQRMA